MSLNRKDLEILHTALETTLCNRDDEYQKAKYLFNLLHKVEKEIDSMCGECDGEGMVDEEISECNDSTGYNRVTETTGKKIKCAFCDGTGKK